MARMGTPARVKKYHEDEEYAEEYRKKLSLGIKRYLEVNPPPFLGKFHKDESKKKISDAMKGKNIGKSNPSFGKHWITDGSTSKLILKTDAIPIGWSKGRV